jgi:hypothetical protein
MVNKQVIMYEDDAPDTEDVPVDQDSPAVAYKKDGTGPILTWDTEAHIWKE